MIIRYLSAFLLFGILASCGSNEKPVTVIEGPEKIPVSLYVVPDDSIIAPIVIPIDEANLTKVMAGIPDSIPVRPNIHNAGQPGVVHAHFLPVNVPGKDTFELPETYPARDSVVVVGMPKITTAKDPHVKDQNSQSFSTFNELHGLGSNHVFNVMRDASGNMWFATAGGGVSRFDGKTFARYAVQQGLGSNTVLDMLEDKNQNLWFATAERAIVKFDGRKFTHIIPPSELDIAHVWSLMLDKAGRIWIAAGHAGLMMYDGVGFTLYTQQQGLSSNTVLSMAEDKSGNIWIGTEGGGICRFDGVGFSQLTDDGDLATTSVNSVMCDSANVIWFGSHKLGLFRYTNGVVERFTVAEGLSSDNITTMTIDATGSLWIGTEGGGVSEFEDNRFVHYTDKEGMMSNVIWSIAQDASGKMWIATDEGGVSRFDGANFQHFSVNDGLRNSNIYCVSEDASGRVWCGTRGGGASVFSSEYIRTYTMKEGLASDVVISMATDRNGNVWMGTRGAGVSRFDGKYFTHITKGNGLGNNNVFSLLEDRMGNIWIGTFGGGVSKFDGHSLTTYTKKQGLPGNVIMCMLEDHAGNIWFGTLDGVCKYDGKQFAWITTEQGLTHNAVLAITEDGLGRLWFATQGGGVCRYENNQLVVFDERIGLNNNIVGSIQIDSKGNIWLGTRSGFSCITGEQMTYIDRKIATDSLVESDVFFRNFSFEDGFIGMNVNGGKTICETSDGKLWVGASDRLTLINSPSTLLNSQPVQLRIDAVELYNEDVQWQMLNGSGDTSFALGNGVIVKGLEFDSISRWYNLPENLSVAYNNNYITFSFAGITMNQTRMVRYHYKIDELDENWSALTLRNSAPYGNIPPGHYTLRVKAMNSAGQWSDETNFAFEVRPPWWQTWWFRSIAIVTAIISLIAVVKVRERNLRKRQHELEITVKERTAEVVSQKHIVEEKQREILDSITYAKRLQHAILATPEQINKYIPDNFLLYKPKDIVAGDFYFFETTATHIFIAAADCTGHGVPGAMVSIVCSNALTRCVKEFQLKDPGVILDKTRELVVETFEKSGKDVKDGMDISFMSIDRTTGEIKWAGANNPVWVVSGNSELPLEEIKGDKQPIGKTENPKPFTTHALSASGAWIYLFTDGYADQFGGPKGKKFKYKQLQEILVQNAGKNSAEQKSILEISFEDWRGELEQIDDVCIIGIKI